MSTERERLIRDVNNLKERVSLVWLDMISKPMTPAERQELRKSIESFLKKLDAKLDQPPTDAA
jgi:DNA replication protein DnaD